MLFLVDFAPLALFLGSYLYSKELSEAIVVLLITMPISLFLKYRMTGKVDKMLMWSTVFAFVFGGGSIYLDDQRVFYWKPTALYWVMAAVFFASNWIGEKPLVKRFFDLLEELPTGHISEQHIRNLNSIWGAFFVFAGVANLYVAYNFSEEFWVKFKVFGLTALTFVFISAQIYWIMSGMKPDTDNEESS